MIRTQFLVRLFIFILAGFTWISCAPRLQPTGVATPANPDVILASTTSANDTGLLDTLIVIFEQQTGYRVKIISVGTGAALELGRRGEADVMLVHAPQAEKDMVAAGYAMNRTFLMVNDFVIAGPENDPAGIKGMASPVEALTRISRQRARFVSRGDDSGTHKVEMAFWQQAGIAPSGAWYIESGSGMGATLRMAHEKQAYLLTDRGTFLVHNDRNKGMSVLTEGAPELLNPYHMLLVNPEKYPAVNADGARAFIEFMTSQQTQEFICTFGVDRFGQPLFYNATSHKAAMLPEGIVAEN